MTATPRWGGLRLEPYDPDADDADGDGIVQEGTAWERPKGTDLLDALGKPIQRGATSVARDPRMKVVRGGKEERYTPTYGGQPQGGQRIAGAGKPTPLARSGAPSLLERGLRSLKERMGTIEPKDEPKPAEETKPAAYISASEVIDVNRPFRLNPRARDDADLDADAAKEALIVDEELETEMDDLDLELRSIASQLGIDDPRLSGAIETDVRRRAGEPKSIRRLPNGKGETLQYELTPQGESTIKRIKEIGKRMRAELARILPDDLKQRQKELVERRAEVASRMPTDTIAGVASRLDALAAQMPSVFAQWRKLDLQEVYNRAKKVDRSIADDIKTVVDWRNEERAVVRDLMAFQAELSQYQRLVISKIRRTGVDSKSSRFLRPKNSTASDEIVDDVFDALDDVEADLPTDWLEAIHDIGDISVDFSERGHFQQGGVSRLGVRQPHELLISGNGPVERRRTAAHEMMHAAEAAMPEIVAAEGLWVFSRISQGEQAVEVLPGEYGFEDEFANSYTGKVYKGGPMQTLYASESLSSIGEAIFGGHSSAMTTAPDDDALDWAFGVIAVAGRSRRDGFDVGALRRRKLEQQKKKRKEAIFEGIKMDDKRAPAAKQVASRLHDSWREGRRAPDGSIAPLIRSHEGGVVDIANTPFDDLPEEYQDDYMASAMHVISAIDANPDASDDEIASMVHVDWLRRNREWATDDQKRPFERLSEGEKGKNRLVVEEAREALKGSEKDQKQPKGLKLEGGEDLDDRERARLRAEQVIAAGAEAEPMITALVQQVTESAGGRMTGLEHRLKTVDSLARKLYDKAKAKGISIEDYARKVADAVRYTAVIDDEPPGNYVAAIRRTIAELEAQGVEIAELESHWLPGDSYDGIHLVGRHPNGTLFELQFHTEQSIEVKGQTHGIYEEIRKADATPEERIAGLLRMTELSSAVPRPEGAIEVGIQMFRGDDGVPRPVGPSGPVRVDQAADADRVDLDRPAPTPRGSVVGRSRTSDEMIAEAERVKDEIEKAGGTWSPSSAMTPEERNAFLREQVPKQLSAAGPQYRVNPIGTRAEWTRDIATAISGIEAEMAQLEKWIAEGKGQGDFETDLEQARQLLAFLRERTPEEVMQLVIDRMRSTVDDDETYVAVNVPLHRWQQFLDSQGVYRTTHEVSSDHSDAPRRAAYEALLGLPVDAPADVRPASGYLVTGDKRRAVRRILGAKNADQAQRKGMGEDEWSPEETYEGVVETTGLGSIYGQTRLKMRPEIKKRTKFGFGDSLNFAVDAAPLEGATDEELLRAMSVFTAGQQKEMTLTPILLALLLGEGTELLAPGRGQLVWRSDVGTERGSNAQYLETLIFGAFDLSDVEEVAVGHDLFVAKGRELFPWINTPGMGDTAIRPPASERIIALLPMLAAGEDESTIAELTALARSLEGMSDDEIAKLLPMMGVDKKGMGSRLDLLERAAVEQALKADIHRLNPDIRVIFPVHETLDFKIGVAPEARAQYGDDAVFRVLRGRLFDGLKSMSPVDGSAGQARAVDARPFDPDSPDIALSLDPVEQERREILDGIDIPDIPAIPAGPPTDVSYESEGSREALSSAAIDSTSDDGPIQAARRLMLDEFDLGGLLERRYEDYLGRETIGRSDPDDVGEDEDWADAVRRVVMPTLSAERRERLEHLLTQEEKLDALWRLTRRSLPSISYSGGTEFGEEFDWSKPPKPPTILPPELDVTEALPQIQALLNSLDPAVRTALDKVVAGKVGERAASDAKYARDAAIDKLQRAIRDRLGAIKESRWGSRFSFFRKRESVKRNHIPGKAIQPAPELDADAHLPEDGVIRDVAELARLADGTMRLGSSLAMPDDATTQEAIDVLSSSDLTGIATTIADPPMDDNGMMQLYSENEYGFWSHLGLQALGQLGLIRGYDSPALKVSAEELDDMVVDGGFHELRRGGAIAPQQEHISGRMLYGDGLLGGGYYFAAQTFAGDGTARPHYDAGEYAGDNGVLLRVGINPNARLIGQKTAAQAVENYRKAAAGEQLIDEDGNFVDVSSSDNPVYQLAGLRSRLASIAKGDGPEAVKAQQAIRNLDALLSPNTDNGENLHSLGVASILMGYDGLDSGLTLNPTNGGDNRVLLYNRSAAVVQNVPLTKAEHVDNVGKAKLVERVSSRRVDQGLMPLDPSYEQINEYAENLARDIAARQDARPATFEDTGLDDTAPIELTDADAETGRSAAATQRSADIVRRFEEAGGVLRPSTQSAAERQAFIDQHVAGTGVEGRYTVPDRTPSEQFADAIDAHLDDLRESISIYTRMLADDDEAQGPEGDPNYALNSEARARIEHSLDIARRQLDFFENSDQEEIEQNLIRIVRQGLADEDTRIAVQVPADRLDELFADGRSKTIHEAETSTKGTAPLRQGYEAAIGIPSDMAPELRPVSGYVLWGERRRQVRENAGSWLRSFQRRMRLGRMSPSQSQLDESVASMEAGRTAHYGGTRIVLRPEVASRTRFGNGDSLDDGLDLAPMQDATDDEILMSLVGTLQPYSHQQRQRLNQLFSWAAHERGLGTANASPLDPIDDGAPETIYQEAAILGGYTIEDIEEMHIPQEAYAPTLPLRKPTEREEADGVSPFTEVKPSEFEQAAADLLELQDDLQLNLPKALQDALDTGDIQLIAEELVRIATGDSIEDWRFQRALRQLAVAKRRRSMEEQIRQRNPGIKLTFGTDFSVQEIVRDQAELDEAGVGSIEDYLRKMLTDRFGVKAERVQERSKLLGIIELIDELGSDEKPRMGGSADAAPSHVPSVADVDDSIFEIFEDGGVPLGEVDRLSEEDAELLDARIRELRDETLLEAEIAASSLESARRLPTSADGRIKPGLVTERQRPSIISRLRQRRRYDLTEEGQEVLDSITSAGSSARQTIFSAAIAEGRITPQMLVEMQQLEVMRQALRVDESLQEVWTKRKEVSERMERLAKRDGKNFRTMTRAERLQWVSSSTLVSEEDEALVKQLTAIAIQTDELRDRTRKLNATLREAIRDQLAKMLPLGGQVADMKIEWPTSGQYDSFVKEMWEAEIANALRFFPTQWLQRLSGTSNEDPLRIAFLVTADDGTGRSYYSPTDHTVHIEIPERLFRNPDDETRGTLVHELAHAVEERVPGVKLAEHLFLWQRTAADPVDFALAIDEDVFKDQFFDLYAGKVYRDGGISMPFELLSMGLQNLLGFPNKTDSVTMDTGYLDFILGLLMSTGRLQP